MPLENGAVAMSERRDTGGVRTNGQTELKRNSRWSTDPEISSFTRYFPRASL